MSMFKFTRMKKRGHYRYTHRYTGDYALVRHELRGWRVQFRDKRGRLILTQPRDHFYFTRTHADARVLVTTSLTES